MDDDGYARARLDVERFSARDRQEIGELGRSLIFDHGRKTGATVLLLHGLTAAPMQFVAIANALHKRGHNVFVPRLPQHGRSDRMSTDLARMTRAQLKACVKDAVAIARGLGDRLIVAGFSLGGALAAFAGQHQRIERAVAIAPFLGIPWVPAGLTSAVAQLLLRLPNRFYWWDPLLRERQMPAHGYPRWSTRALGESLLLAQEILSDARETPPATRQLVIAINRKEPSVSNRDCVKLAAMWRRNGADVHLERLSGVPFVHDIIEPLRYPEIARRLLPQLVELIDDR